jgi:ribosome-associated toxin RatA of RatAB toxin-antitoxin module
MYYNRNGFEGSLNYLPGEDLQFPNINASEAALEIDSHVSIGNLGKIAQQVFNNPKIASYNFKTEVYESPFFDEQTSIDNVYYIIGDANDIQQLLVEDAKGNIKVLENRWEVKSLNRHNTLFLFKDKEDIGKLNTTIIDTKLDLKNYNFLWTTIADGINHDRIVNKQFPRTENEHTLRRSVVLMTKANLDQEYNNVLIKYEDGDVKFDFAYKNSINVIAAQSGNLKSTFVNNLVSAFVNQTNDLGFTFHDDDRKDGIVLLFDTETDEKKLAQMWNFHNNPNEKLKYVSLKNISKDERLIYLNSVIISFLEEGESIRAVVIDGLLDFIVDFNNIEESERLIDNVLEIIKIYDTSVFVTFQENPARYNGTNNKLTGHIGTMLHRKCDSHYNTSAKGDIVEIHGQKIRTHKGFTLVFDIDSSGDFLVLKTNGIKTKEKKVSQKKLDILLDGLDTLFINKNQITNDEIIEWISTQIDVKNRAAESWKQKLIDLDKIMKVDSSGKFATWVRV